MKHSEDVPHVSVVVPERESRQDKSYVLASKEDVKTPSVEQSAPALMRPNTIKIIDEETD